MTLQSGGTLDLTNNQLDVENATLSAVTAQIASAYNNGTWTGTGITSSTAEADLTRLTALGVVVNNNGAGSLLYGSGTALGTFGGSSPSLTDVLVKYTYYGDTNLDGHVDGTDYSRIDNGFISQLTGWFNGDFNYDQSVDGSDYTLIDNAFNMQGAALATSVAAPDAAIAGDPPTSAAVIARSTKVDQARKPNGAKRSTTATPSVFQTGVSITFAIAAQSVEATMQRKDLLDLLAV